MDSDLPSSTASNPYSSTSEAIAPDEAIALFNLAVDLLGTASLDGFFQTINPAFERTLGYSIDELTSQPFFNFIHPDDQIFTANELKKVNAGATILSFTNRYRCKNGEYKWLEWTAVPVLHRGIMYVTARDVTERKQQEIALRASEERWQRANETLEQRVAERTTELEQAYLRLAERETRYRTLAQHIPNGSVVLFDHNLRYLLCEGEELKRVRLDAQEMVGKTIWEVFPPELCEQIEPQYRAALSGQTSVQQVSFQHQIYETYAVPIWNEHNQVSAGMVLVQNVTDRVRGETKRKRVEASLRESRALLKQRLAEIEAIYQSTLIGLAVFDTNLCFVRINQRLAEMSGFPVKAHLGHSLGELFPGLADRMESFLRLVLETGAPQFDVEIQGETPAQPGVQRNWLAHFFPLTNGDRVNGISIVCEEITDRRRAELALRESHIQLQSALAAGLIYTWRWNVPANLVIVDRHFANLFGIDPEGATTGLPVEQFLNAIHADDRVRVAAAIERAIATGADFAEEYRVFNAAGQEHWVIARGRAEYDAQGNAIAFPGALADITDRKQAEAALQQSEDRYRMAVTSAKLGTWDWDLTTNELRWDAGCKTMFGLPPEADGSIELFFQSLHPGDRDRLTKLIQNVLKPESDGSYDTEYRAIGIQDGIERWVAAKGQVYFSHTRQPLRFVGTVLDITDRKQAEEALRRSEERYRILFELMEDGFCVVEVLFDECNTPIDYRFLEVNPAFEVQTGLQQAEGKTARQLLPDLERHWFEIYGRVALTGEAIRFEAGSEVMDRFFEVYAFHIGSLEGHKVAILFRNISDRKAIEVQRERLLQQERAAREAAERANRIKDEFLAILSHELRSPLNPILGWTKLMQSRNFSPARTAEALATIERNAKLQIQLIDDLLDTARILRGKLSLTVAPVDLVFIIEAAIDTVSTAATTKSIILNAVLPQIGQVAGDATRLQQIVWNLLSNAVKFTPAGGQVDVELQRVDNQAKIVVRDTGKGIAPEFLPYLFEAFRQEDSSITRKYGGLGLGLAIVRHLVEAHGGTVGAESGGDGQGATFTVCLPLLNTERTPTQPPELPAHNLDLTGIRVLAIDDEMDARELLTAILAAYGAEVLTVASAVEVVSALESFQPDVLVSDVGMPNVDGYALIQQVRSRSPEKGGNIPAIALTAYAREEDRQRALAVGFQHHIAKPIDPDLLVQCIANLLRRKRELGDRNSLP